MKIDKPLSSQITALRRLWHESFDETEDFLNDFYRTAFSADRCRCVTVDGEIAAALYWFECLHMERPLAYLYAVATAEAFRRQGICHKLMEDTHHQLAKLGYEGVILVPGNKALFRLYEGMGYRKCSNIRKINCAAGSADEVRLCRIAKDEYARLRRQMLPAGGVVQENENLDLLQTQEQFYAGEGFLLAAHEEGDAICGVELLGDDTVAPGIVKTLGYARGVFRTPGDDDPFAMYYALGDSKLPPPSYFGLAFDW